MPTITVQTKSNESFSVEYEAEKPPSMDYVSVNVIKICIKDYELEYYGFKILHSELFEEIVSKCKEDYEAGKDDLKHVNIG